MRLKYRHVPKHELIEKGLWDTCAIITYSRPGQFLTIPEVKQQLQRHKYSGSLILTDDKRETRERSADERLLHLSTRGHIIITLDKGLTRRIRERGGMVVHPKILEILDRSKTGDRK